MHELMKGKLDKRASKPIQPYYSIVFIFMIQYYLSYYLNIFLNGNCIFASIILEYWQFRMTIAKCIRIQNNKLKSEDSKS